MRIRTLTLPISIGAIVGPLAQALEPGLDQTDRRR
jgi:hypothetical protein